MVKKHLIHRINVRLRCIEICLKLLSSVVRRVIRQFDPMGSELARKFIYAVPWILVLSEAMMAFKPSVWPVADADLAECCLSLYCGGGKGAKPGLLGLTEVPQSFTTLLILELHVPVEYLQPWGDEVWNQGGINTREVVGERKKL